MQRLKMHTPDITDENIEKIAALFPNCITEMRQKKGAVMRAIDFDQLRQELSKSPIVDGLQERYQLNWPGKHEALIHANKPILKTFRPYREESVDFDNTKNLYIEGDNLDALKLLQETYLNKVKMIYIDPPYNTGNDFIYKDDFRDTKSTYAHKSNQIDEDGNQMVLNPESNGRFHSDWLSMMYPRLKLARNLLRDDGVIFISIDNNEIDNLKKLCDEIFGESNFIGTLIWRKKDGGGQTDAYFVTEHEYIVCYKKSSKFIWNDEELLVDDNDFTREDSLGRFKIVKLSKWGNAARKEDRPKMFFPIKDPDNKNNYPIAPDGSQGRWRVGKNRMEKLINSNLIYWEKRKDKWTPYEKIYHIEDMVKKIKERSILYEIATTSDGTNELTELFSKKDIFENPKPTELISWLIFHSINSNDICLDFFSGSGTSAHAVLNHNFKNKTNIQFILVQMPEKLTHKHGGVKLNLNNICEIGKERIRLAGKKIKEENADKESIEKLDVGFRVLKIDESNMKDIYYSSFEMMQSNLVEQIDNIREGRTPDDLLFQVLLDLGVDLTLPIIQKKILGKTVFFIDPAGSNALAASFDLNISESFVKDLAAYKPLRVVFRDAGFENDSLKINIEQIFKYFSPDTEIKTL